ncbi:GntR family transcriptional regulator [Aquisalimonas asiatica]|uniref:DNA-binding transcriptional regulator, GntR family n=1 Tax=Aquisalimonas asiatica TaxID=406100 RepID=A0A1H8PQU0_9GAMM|nr:GntR family transcriptional regulator [Aquisalimonas asiatica]SEO43893.1 DNA-binding transcriptional regulator, GntR family [Aquisalimonas asiatica]
MPVSTIVDPSPSGGEGNLSVTLAEALGERIIKGELPPGSRLLEMQLAADMGVSRGPLREALRVLEKRRLVRILPRRGALVSDMGPDDVRCLYEVVTPLYQTLTRAVAERWTPESLPALYTVVERMINCAEQGDVEGYYEHNFTFARACAPIVGNPLLDELLTDLEPGLRRVLYHSREARAAAVGSHLDVMRRMMRCVMDRDGVRASGAIGELAALELRLAMASFERMD